MAERIVSVKMPGSLVRELHTLREQHHYLDLSEQLRSIVRQKCLALTNPYTEELRRLRSDLEQDAVQSTNQNAREQVLKELIKLLREDRR